MLGATLVTSGHMTARATRVGNETVLAQIIRMVDEATSSKAPVARLADQVSAVFVPFVIGVALLSLAIWLLIGRPSRSRSRTPSRSSSFRVRAPWGSPPPRP